MSRPVRSLLTASFAVLACAAMPAAPALAGPALSPSEVGEAANGPGVFRFPQAIAVSPDGLTTYVGDQYGGRIQAFGPGGRLRFVFGGRATRGEQGRLGVVGGIAVDRNDHLYVADSENNRIQVFSAKDGRFVTQFGTGDKLKLMQGGRADRGIVSGGIGVYQASSTSTVVVYVADSGNNRILRYSVNRNTGRPYSAPKKSSSALKLKRPQGVSVDPGGKQLFVPDNQNHRVQVLDPRTLERVDVFGKNGKGPGQFQSPYDVAIEARKPRQLYVADNLNGRVNVFDAKTFDYIGTFGGNGHEPGKFSIVRAIASSANARAGGVSVADTANNRIQVVSPTGDIIGAWGIAGRGPGYVTRPRGVAVAPDGTIAAADTFDNRISLTAADGTWAGQRGEVSRSTGFVAPGSVLGRYLLPEGVAYDAAGRSWVADTGNKRLVGLDATGRAFFQTPKGALTRPGAVATGPDGTAYVTDRTRGRLFAVPPGGGALRQVGGSSDAPNSVAVSRGGQIFVGGRRTIRDAASGSKLTPPPGAKRWDRVSGLAFAPDGTLYVSELGLDAVNGARVLRGTPIQGGGYSWETIANEGTGPGQVVEPQGLAVSANGRTIFVTDGGNDRILRLDAPGAAPPRTNAMNVAVTGGVTRGRITSVPDGIDCATDCVQSYGVTRQVTLTARPTEGSTFNGWTGACAGATTQATCTLPMNEARTVGATFGAPPPPPVKLSRLKLAPRTLHLTRPKARRLSQRRATRATLSFSVTQKAKGALQVQEARTGRKRGGSCRALPRRSRAKGNCVRWVTQKGTRTLRLIPGDTKVVLVPRVVKRTLKPGRYRVVLTATDAAKTTVARHSGTFRITR